MIKVLFFAQTRELVSTDELLLEGEFNTVEELRSHLASQKGKWDLAMDPSRLLAAVNQSIVPLTHSISSGDEVAFFPPVTGG
ncbi:molybdopterin synthase sulfur carrier subunit [Vibrio kasasachensis]|uniref:molybdopterin synthase sulfur carrier subunit n=1 Tax=Vibrio kasasachensis TaxID=2910248 RepID=UPI003D0FE616